MARFAPIPEIPLGGITDWMFALLSAMKENIDLLTGMRGENDNASTSLTKSSITVAPPLPMGMTKMSATGAGFTIQGVQVASLDDHNKLIQDVARLTVDVANLRGTVNALISNLKG